MKKKAYELIIIGGGLAGTEAAYQAAKRGIRVLLYEMRPQVMTPAHVTGNLAELVCSNSLGSKLPDRATGLLNHELKRLGSLLIDCAEKNAVPAGGALAVDRDKFSACVADVLNGMPEITIMRDEVTAIPEQPAIIATGPLTSGRMAAAIAEFTGSGYFYFYDAISPIVTVESIDFEKAFRASRYQRGTTAEGDYINCPMNKDEYERFVDALVHAERISLKSFEAKIEQGVTAGHDAYFEGCLPIEVIAERGKDSLAFGPMRPVGLTDPHTGRRPYAVVQLRQDNLAGDLFNLVGFQTNLKFPEQARILRMIPGLEHAEFVRYGQMHRNTFINSPKVLLPTLQTKKRKDLFFAGQITGIEGYLGNIASGWLAGVNAARVLGNGNLITLPQETMLGALCDYIANASEKDFQPMKANFGLLPPLSVKIRGRRAKRVRAQAYAERAQRVLEEIILRENTGDCV